MKTAKYFLPVFVLACGVFVSSTVTFAKPDYAKKEAKPCQFCHVDAKKTPKELSEAGKFYSTHDHSLKGYTPSK